jgi:hypothetical protein
MKPVPDAEIESYTAAEFWVLRERGYMLLYIEDIEDTKTVFRG